MLGSVHKWRHHLRGRVGSAKRWQVMTWWPGERCFVANQFFSPFTRTQGGGIPERWHDDKRGEGVWIPPKSDDVIYEQPLRLVFSEHALRVWSANKYHHRESSQLLNIYPETKVYEIFLQPDRSLVTIRKYHVQGSSQSRYCLPCMFNSKGQLVNRALPKAQQTTGIKIYWAL